MTLPRLSFLLPALVCALALTLQAQEPAPSAPPEPTPLPGVPPPTPAPSPARPPRAEPPPLPTPVELPSAPSAPAPSPTPVFERAKPQPPTPENPEPVEPYQPALPLATPAPKAPVLTRVRVVLEGNSRFSSEQIRTALADQLAAIEQSGLSPALADDSAFFLGVFYRRNGYSQAAVQWNIASRNTLRLSIVEGPLTHLGKVTFRGNVHLPDATLLDYITGGTRERFPVKKQGLPYIESDVASGVERIRGLYRSEGYLDAVVDAPETALSPDKTRADVTLNIHEGPQYRFGEITFQGDVIFYPQSDLLKEMEVFTSKPYTPVALTNLERKIVYFYKRHGYFTATVRSESDPSKAVDGRVAVRFIVEAGEVYRFDGVTQSGLKKLRPSFLRKRFSDIQGQVYDPEKIEERYRRLMGTGLFTNLKLTQEPLPGNEVGLHFDVEEAKARELGFSVGYAKLEGLILGSRYVDRDLFGNGRPLTVDAEVAQRLLRGQVSYTDPWILDTDTTLGLRLYALNQDLDGYSKTESGFRPELTRKFGKHWELGAFLLSRVVQIQDNGIDPIDVGLTHYRTDSAGLSATYDTRDSVLNPRRGFLFNVTGDYASTILGSSLEFWRTTFRASYYLPVGTDSLLAAGVRGGVISPLGYSEDLPIDERFFNGGANTVRSFNERTLGPKDTSGHPVGGETFTAANLEFVTPIRDNLDLALFTDAGSTGRYRESGMGQTGFAIGPGLRYRLPIGPIRLDYGWNPFHRPNQPTGAIHFTFGFAF
ncbi:MAG: outer membrane protein assembly factor BamA [Chthoniobacteraceae bacterium]|nr:outer membrane protein assembly factor BamA [Chthoniobacteraceae bacterium]